MSLVLLWSNDAVAFILSDGMVINTAREVIQRDRCKFFRTAAGVTIAGCGQSTPCDLLNIRFRNSTVGFSQLVPEVAEFVRQIHRDFQPTEVAKPLGVLVVGIEDGSVKAAEISATETHLSVPGRNFVAWLAAPREDFQGIRKFMSVLGVCADWRTIPKYLRQFAERLFAEFPNEMGGKIYTDTLALPEPEPTFCDMNQQGSQNAVSDNSAFSYLATANGLNSTVAFWWSQFTVPFIDGTTITVAAEGSESNPAYTEVNLEANLTYYFGAAYITSATPINANFQVGKAAIVIQSTQPLTPAQITQELNADGRAPIFSNWAIAVPATGTSSGGGSTNGSLCFTGDARVRTPRGPVAFSEMSDVIEIENETGRFTADVIRHENEVREMIALPEGGVTPDHLIKANGEWIPASAAFPNSPHFKYSGTLFNLHTRDAAGDAQSYIVEPGIVAHNFKFGNPA